MTRFFLGSLNRPGPYFHATGEGLITCVLDEATGSITRLHAQPDAENAIWLTRDGPLLLVATERYLEPGEISAFALSETGPPIRIGTAQSSHGGAICHAAFTPDRLAVVVASYLGGITVHEISAAGGVAAAHQIIDYQGSGPHPERQDQPHPHQAVVAPDGGSVWVCDLGTDRIHVHPLDGHTLGPAADLVTPSGSGPRHLVFHPVLPRCYVLGELDAMVHLYDVSGSFPVIISSHATLPAEFTGEPAGAAIRIHPSCHTLIVSNRNSDTLAFFRIDATGGLALAACVPTGGRTPRDFAVSPSGRWLLAVNQDSHGVVPIELEPETGLPNGRRGPDFPCGSPVCAIF